MKTHNHILYMVQKFGNPAKNVWTFKVGAKTEGKRPFRRRRRSWECNIKTDLKGVNPV